MSSLALLKYFLKFLYSEFIFTLWTNSQVIF